MRIAVIGVPYTSDGLPGGEARSPAALRAAGLVEAFRRGGHDVNDGGDVAILPATPERDSVSGIIAPGTLVSMVSAVRAAVVGALADGRFPVVIGGECPLLLGCLAAARDVLGRVGLLFVDGHEDAWPPHASTTGEAADMELGLALGLNPPDGLGEIADLLPLLRPQDVVLLGPRDRVEIQEGGVASLSGAAEFLNDRQIQEADAAGLIRTWANRLAAATAGWWFHLDLDVLSTEALAAVRYPQPGGLVWAELEALTAAALASPGMIGWDLTIYNPDLDPSGDGAARIVTFVASVMASLPR